MPVHYSYLRFHLACKGQQIHHNAQHRLNPWTPHSMEIPLPPEAPLCFNDGHHAIRPNPHTGIISTKSTQCRVFYISILTWNSGTPIYSAQRLSASYGSSHHTAVIISNNTTTGLYASNLAETNFSRSCVKNYCNQISAKTVSFNALAYLRTTPVPHRKFQLGLFR